MEAQLRRVLVSENPWLRGEDLQEWIQRFLPAEMAVGSTRVRFLQVEELSGRAEAFLAADRVPSV